MFDDIKYPHIEVQLTGEDGNAFAILARVDRALREDGEVTAEERQEYYKDATSKDYNHLLTTTMKTVTVS